MKWLSFVARPQHTLTLGLGLMLGVAQGGCSAEVGGVFGSGGSGGDGGSSGSLSTTGGPTTGTQSGAQSGAQTGTSSAQSTTSSAVTSSVAATSVQSSAATTDVATSSTGQPDPTVACENAGQCSIAGAGICCWTDQQGSGECQSSDDQCQNGGGVMQVKTAIECQTPEQCPGQVCCAHRLFNSTQSPYDRVACASDCSSPDRPICDPNAPVCPGGTTCKQSQLLPTGYFICTPN